MVAIDCLKTIDSQKKVSILLTKILILKMYIVEKN